MIFLFSGLGVSVIKRDTASLASIINDAGIIMCKNLKQINKPFFKSQFFIFFTEFTDRQKYSYFQFVCVLKMMKGKIKTVCSTRYPS